MELLHRNSSPKVSVVYRVPRPLERFERLELFERATAHWRAVGGLDEGLRNCDRSAIPKKIEPAPEIRKGFQDLTRLS
jgi:hypothetical protein